VIEAALNSLARGAGVERASVMSGLPVGAGSMITPGGAVGTDRPSALVELVAASTEVFSTLGVAMVSGRNLDARDMRGADPVAVLSESAANVVFGRPDVVGRQVLFKRSRWSGEDEHPVRRLTIVGIAADTDTGIVGRRDHGVVYLPLAQHFEPRLLFAVRTAGDPAEAAELLRRTLRSIDPELAVAQFGTGEHLAGGVSMFAKVTGSLAGTLGTFALLLALAGLYGVLSHLVSRRTREIGLRMALGASRGAVLRLILREGLAPVALGIAVGAALGVLGGTLLRPLFPVPPAVDYGWLAGVGLGLVAAALIACYVPARRAASVEPWTALRDL
jgi:putative ABC transport system permease protein